MKKFVASLALAIGLVVAAPASAQELDRWTVTLQETPFSEAALSNLAVTRAEGEEVNESMVLACRPDDDVTICVDVWNSTSYNDDDAVRAATGETDLEVEASFHRLLSGFTLRVKGAVYMIEGEDIYSLRVAIDHALGDSCSGTAFVETMTGVLEFQVYKVSATCRASIGEFNLSGDVGVAYNTLNNETVVPVEARFMRGERLSAGLVIGAYFAEDRSDVRVGFRFVYQLIRLR